ncbi:MAG: CoA transferase [Pseudomonadota bacterium]
MAATTLTPPDVTASDYAEKLAIELGAPSVPGLKSDHPAVAWRRAGVDAITGFPDSDPLPAPVALTSAADGALAVLKSFGSAAGLPTTGALLLGERARLTGLTRKGRTAPGGDCHLIDCLDGAIALNLARTDDWDLLPAWLEDDGVDDLNSLQNALAQCSGQEIVERGRAIGLPIALADGIEPTRPWRRLTHFRRREMTERAPVVIDLSSLWAGPLAGQLLVESGATVIKVESVNRPDGARRGDPDFYALMNAGKSSVALDFHNTEDRRVLGALIEKADIVIEGSRPRALRQMGLIAEDWLSASPGRIWLSITAYGRRAPEGEWVGFGDDVGVAAGLSRLMRDAYGAFVFVGDAIADPLTGLHAAAAALASWRAGGGALLDISMCGVIQRIIDWDAAQLDRRDTTVALRARAEDWRGVMERDDAELYPLRAVHRRKIASLGQDNERIIGDLHPC